MKISGSWLRITKEEKTSISLPCSMFMCLTPYLWVSFPCLIACCWLARLRFVSRHYGATPLAFLPSSERKPEARHMGVCTYWQDIRLCAAAESIFSLHIRSSPSTPQAVSSPFQRCFSPPFPSLCNCWTAVPVCTFNASMHFYSCAMWSLTETEPPPD